MNENVKRWLDFANIDLQMAELAFNAEFYSQTCFHGQQCVEKMLKGVLVHIGQNPPQIHSIGKLLQLLPPGHAQTFDKDLPIFDDFYIPTRYPDALPGMLPEGLPGKEDAERALSLAHSTAAIVERMLSNG